MIDGASSPCFLILLNFSGFHRLIHVLVGLSLVVGQLVKGLITNLGDVVDVVEVPVTSDSSGQEEILLHDGDSLGVDSTEVCVLENADEVGLSSFLDGEQCL